MTCCVDGFTIAVPPMVTVGTVSFPSATERTKAAACGSCQMSTSVCWRPVRRIPSRSSME
jgi:hypothetical protein